MIRSILLTSVASLAWVSAAGAQTTPPAPPTPPQDTSAPEKTGDDIVVTGSRIVANGFQQPTPVTVLGSTEINREAPMSQRPALEVTNGWKSFGHEIEP